MTVAISIQGKLLEGFERGQVVLAMDSAANTFNFEYSADPDNLALRHVYAGDPCTIELDGEEVLDGYVVTTNEEDGEDAVRLGAAGYSRTGDLAKASLPPSVGPWSGVTISRIVRDLAAPFSINVYVEGDEGERFANFAAQKGDTVYETIVRAALRRGFRPYCTGGDLILARAGGARTSTVLARGDGRVIRSSRMDSWEERFSDYLFRGQARSTDGTFGPQCAHLRSSVRDPYITRYLPLLVTAEARDTLDLQTRAQFECNTRAGQGENITAVVHGWTTDEGNLWRPNTLVRFQNPVLGVDATLLVVRATFQVGHSDPRETELLLTRPEAFDLANYPANGRGESWT